MKQDRLNDFMHLMTLLSFTYKNVIESLETMLRWADNETSSKKRSIRNSTLDIGFLIPLFV